VEVADLPVEVRRSPRRRRSVQAYIDGGTVVVLIPASFSRTEERRHIEDMVGKLSAARAKVQRRGTDVALARRAEELSNN